HVPDESVAHDHVRLAAENITPLNVADKLDWQRLQQWKCLVRKIVSLAFFLANRKQAHARLADLKHAPRLHLTHHSELFKVVGLAIHVGAYVQQHARISGRARHWSRKRRPI